MLAKKTTISKLLSIEKQQNIQLITQSLKQINAANITKKQSILQFR
jgi:hypothetical protein